MPRITLRRLAIWFRWLVRPRRTRSRVGARPYDIQREVETARDSILAQSY